MPVDCFQVVGLISFYVEGDYVSKRLYEIGLESISLGLCSLTIEVSGSQAWFRTPALAGIGGVEGLDGG